MKKRTISKVLAASVLALAASVSQAAIVDNWNFELKMEWDTTLNATKFSKGGERGNGEMGYWTSRYGFGTQSVTSTSINWGTSGGSYHSPITHNARSGIEIIDPYIPGNVATSIVGQTPVTAQANMFRHYNTAIFGTYKSLQRAKMDLAVQVWNPYTNELVLDIPRSFEIHFYETPNIPGQCAWGVCEDDIFAVVSGIGLTDTFMYGGVEYTLNYFETTAKIQQLSTTTCTIMGFSGESCFGFTTLENGTTDVKFNISITAVPEPETYAMLLAGLGMIGVVARRRRVRH